MKKFYYVAARNVTCGDGTTEKKAEVWELPYCTNLFTFFRREFNDDVFMAFAVGSQEEADYMADEWNKDWAKNGQNEENVI